MRQHEQPDAFLTDWHRETLLTFLDKVAFVGWAPNACRSHFGKRRRPLCRARLLCFQERTSYFLFNGRD
jgi:hypothetical protein